MRESNSGVLIFDGKVNTARLKNAQLTVERLLDRYYLIFEEFDLAGRATAELVLFEHIAAHYDDEIDCQNNIRMIDTLVKLVALPAAQSQRILDYGCGTGLSARVGIDHGIDLLGFDRSPTMRSIAQRRGVRTLDRIELSHLPKASIDGMFASYVLHLAASSEDLAAAADAVRLRGRLAANFHKGRRWSEVGSVLEALGFVPERLSASLDEQHVAMWRRGSA